MRRFLLFVVRHCLTGPSGRRVCARRQLRVRGRHRPAPQVHAALDASAFDWSLVPAQSRSRSSATSPPGARRATSGSTRASQLGPVRLGDDPGRVRPPGRLLPFDTETRERLTGELGRARLVLGVPGLATPSTAVSASPPRSSGPTGPPAQRVQAGVVERRVGCDAPAAFRTLVRGLLGLDNAFATTRSATDGALSRRPASSYRLRAWPSPSARACARSRAR